MSSSSPKLSSSSHSQSTTPTHRHPHHPSPDDTIMLERALSSRRYNLHGDPDSDDASTINGDESKTKKHQHLFFRITNRASNYLSRSSSSSQYWACAIVTLSFLLLFLLGSSFLFTSRGFVCISSYDPVSRARFFGFDGLESDFGALGVPCCKFLFSAHRI